MFKMKIVDLFDKMGVDEIWQRNHIVNDNEYWWHREDFEKGGKMEKFANYTVGRFQNEFSCTLWVCG